MANVINHTDCSPFAVRDKFDTYITSLLIDGQVNLPLVQTCRTEICVAIWGQGNPDISGIGMIVGYVLDHVLGLLLAVLVLHCRPSSKKSSRWRGIPASVLASFHDCAAFLTFSLQTAAIVVLVKEEAGLGTQGMGDGSVRITEAVSLLSLLPLAYAVVLLRPAMREGGPGEDERKNNLETESRRSNPLGKKGTEEIEGARAAKKRFGVLVLCWLMALFPFYCKMNNVFGSSKISDAPGSVISVENFGIIEGVCFQGVTPISSVEDHMMSALAILAYIPMSVLVLGYIIAQGMEKHHSDSMVYRWLQKSLSEKKRRYAHRALIGGLAVVPLLAAGLIWTVLRVQRFQTQLANSVNAGDADAQWTFGQVVACTVFTPVIIDFIVLTKEAFSAEDEPESGNYTTLAGETIAFKGSAEARNGR